MLVLQDPSVHLHQKVQGNLDHILNPSTVTFGILSLTAVCFRHGNMAHRRLPVHTAATAAAKLLCETVCSKPVL